MTAVRLTREQLINAPDTDASARFSDTLDATRQKVIDALDDDFNAPTALAALQTLTREVNTLLNGGESVGRSTLEAIDKLYTELGGTILGIIPTAEVAASGDAKRETGLIELLISLRKQARDQKQWALSDQIRGQLAALGVVLEDRAESTAWHIAENVGA